MEFLKLIYNAFCFLFLIFCLLFFLLIFLSYETKKYPYIQFVPSELSKKNITSTYTNHRPIFDSILIG